MATDQTPRVTIITPVYNGERFIARCIASALAQTFADWEQIVVDDGSTDRTAEIVHGFNDPRVRWLPLPHRGITALADTYNAALRAARGDLIAVLEGDDAWPHDKLATQIPGFDASDMMLSWGRAIVIDENDRPLRRWQCPRTARRDRSSAAMFRLLARWNVLPALTVMTRRTALEQIGGFQQLGSQLLVDWPTWLVLTANVSGTVKFIDHNIGWYRMHGTNAGHVNLARLRFEHQSILSAVLERVGRERLKQLGWSEHYERVVRTTVTLAQGIGQLHTGGRAPARAAFAHVLRETSSLREFVTALLGYGSAIIGIDGFAQAQKLRQAAASLPLRFDKSAGQA